MVQSRVTTSRRASVFALLLSATALLLAGLGQRAAEADHMTVTAVRGSAFGCSADYTFFGTPRPDVGPLPTVTLPAGGSASPITGTAASCDVPTGAGPSIISSGALNVSTQGILGPTGFVTSTATIDSPGSPTEAFEATSISSTCSASETGVTGSTTVVGGTIEVNTNDNDALDTVPVNPAPNTTIFVDNGVATSNYIFNEQILSADGSTLTVNALRIQPLTGPVSQDSIIILGQVVCGVTTEALPPPPDTTTTTTVAPTTSTSTTSTTVAPTTSTSTTSTTVAPTTSTSTTTIVAGACVPGEDGAKPGYGKGDKNHRHCGPPGQTGIRPVASSRDGGPSWPLLAGLGVLLLISLVLPFRRSTRGDHRANR